MGIFAFVTQFLPRQPSDDAHVYAAIKKNEAFKEQLGNAIVFCDSGWPTVLRAYFKQVFARHPARKKIFSLITQHGFDALVSINAKKPLSDRAQELEHALMSLSGFRAPLPLNKGTKLWNIINSYVVIFKQQLLRSLLDLYADLRDQKLITQAESQEGMEGAQAVLHSGFLNLSRVPEMVRQIEEK